MENFIFWAVRCLGEAYKFYKINRSMFAPKGYLIGLEIFVHFEIFLKVYS